MARRPYPPTSRAARPGRGKEALTAIVTHVHLVTVIHISETAPPEGRVAQKRATRTEAILACAADLVATEGLERLTLQRLGAAMGIVPAALYRYFDSKDALVAALQRRAVATTHAAFTAARADAGPALRKLAPPVAALAELFTAARFYLDLPRTHPNEWLLVATLLGDPRPLVSDEEARRTGPLLGAFLGDVRTRVEAAVAAGALAVGDAGLRTMILWTALHGAHSLAKARRISPELPEPMVVGMAALQSLALGWGATPDSITKAARSGASSQKRGTAT